MHTTRIKWQHKSHLSMWSCSECLSCTGHRALGLSTLGEEIYASLNVLYAKDQLFKKGGELGLGSNWDVELGHEYFSSFFQVHTAPPKVYPFGVDCSNHRTQWICMPCRFWKAELMPWMNLSKNATVGGSSWFTISAGMLVLGILVFLSKYMHTFSFPF